MRGVLPDFAFFSKPGERWERVEGYGEKISLRLPGHHTAFPPGSKDPISDKIISIVERREDVLFGHSPPKPCHLRILTGRKYLFSFCFMSCFNFVLEVS